MTPFLTVSYYEALARKAGGRQSAQDFARLFMVPGMDHCGIGQDGPGIADTGIDPLTALERWVEQGQAPDQLEARKVAAGRPSGRGRSAPIRRSPSYKGSGDVKDAASFACAGRELGLASPLGVMLRRSRAGEAGPGPSRSTQGAGAWECPDVEGASRRAASQHSSA